MLNNETNSEDKRNQLRKSILEHAQLSLQRGDIDLDTLLKILEANTNEEVNEIIKPTI